MAGQIGVTPRSTEQITVTVHVADQLLRAGVISHLGRAGLRVLESPGRATGSGPDLSDTVAVVVSDRLDELTQAELRRLVRGGRRPVVFVAAQLREPELVKVLECGVQSIVWRHQATPERLAQAVRTAARGDGDLPPDLLSQLLSVVGRAQRTGSPAGPALYLAPREVSVLRLVADGLETRQIAEQLAYSERTVKNVLHGIMSRMQLTNRAHAVAYALREGYL
ncbi:response regulator transcription factor [Kineosporia sp. J2-2]|uniref:Response regulator transcription factor n=1 Tax=Kineosporia corallincola TaxID=2835133 RepID=A0ABS5TP72_9ACTN|nr:response regulator transcription factor [Kineosporia corallincola]MBT0772887.1 response regulator transcription factor [Kineosporia corallincola]